MAWNLLSQRPGHKSVTYQHGRRKNKPSLKPTPFLVNWLPIQFIRERKTTWNHPWFYFPLSATSNSPASPTHSPFKYTNPDNFLLFLLLLQELGQHPFSLSLLWQPPEWCPHFHSLLPHPLPPPDWPFRNINQLRALCCLKLHCFPGTVRRKQLLPKVLFLLGRSRRKE